MYRQYHRLASVDVLAVAVSVLVLSAGMFGGVIILVSMFLAITVVTLILLLLECVLVLLFPFSHSFFRYITSISSMVGFAPSHIGQNDINVGRRDAPVRLPYPKASRTRNVSRTSS
jgi:hypothetical protein